MGYRIIGQDAARGELSVDLDKRRNRLRKGYLCGANSQP